MRKIFIAVCLTSAVFFFGCGKKSKKEEDTKVAMSEINDTEIPLYSEDGERIFDSSQGTVRDLAFVDDGVEELIEREDRGVDSEFDEWDDADSELNLAWDDSEKNEFEFKVVNFDLNRNEIREDQKGIVSENVKLADNAVKSGKTVVVAGHSCILGSESYNLSLSEKRAKAIRDEMIKNGIPSDKVKILGCGGEYPLVISDSINRQDKIKELGVNRRAEISVS